MYTNKNVLYVVSKLSFPNFVNENNFYNFEYSSYNFFIVTAKSFPVIQFSVILNCRLPIDYPIRTHKIKFY